MLEQEDFLTALGQNINRIRKEKGLSFQELALEADIEKSNLVKLTSHGTNITVLTLNKIACALGVEPAELLRFKTN
ncbi:MAG: helix-turn-helix domain-containing protein [Bacteroidetes bacterium]|nr:helix-turn-helix domain-containing protein [Bacteroidota bacterium]HET6245377.1 helix-turn-helix domain-containing protein [Bacteroidia bacterium]